MHRMLLAGLLLFSPRFLLAQSAPPLQPTGPWVVEGDDNMCALSHAYGTGRSSVTVGVRPWPIGDLVDVLLFTHGAAAFSGRGTAELTIGSPGERIEAPYVRFALKGRDESYASFTIARSALADLASTSIMTISLDRRPPISVAPAGTEKALTVLSKCDDTLLKSLGVDPAFEAGMTRPPAPIGDKDSWVRTPDYPSQAVIGGAQGNTRVLLTVGTDGHVQHCTAFGRSGNAAMDDAACSGLTRRARYKPALDAAGRPMVAYVTEVVAWKLP